MLENFLSESFLDFPDNTSHCVILYMSGCNHSCQGCHNKDLQTYRPFNITKEEVVKRLKEYCSKSQTDKLCIQGGDPLYYKNIDLTKYILSEMGKEYIICIYTGFDIDFVKKLNLKGFQYIKCGCYKQELRQESKKTDNYIQFASSNQKLYDNNLNLLSMNGIYYF